MAVPWFRIFKMAVGATNVARQVARHQASSDASGQLAAPARRSGLMEGRLAGVVVAALREAFDRDHQRLEFEREQLEIDRQRAERSLRLELARQAADREVAHLHVLTGTAAVSWLGSLFLSATFVGVSRFAQAALGLGWLLLIGALAATFVARARVRQELDRLVRAETPAAGAKKLENITLADWSTHFDVTATGLSGAAAQWLIVAGLTAIALATLTR